MPAKQGTRKSWGPPRKAENRQMAWGWSDVNSWYKNDLGRVAQNWPFTLLEYWRRTRRPNPTECEFLD